MGQARGLVAWEAAWLPWKIGYQAGTIVAHVNSPNATCRQQGDHRLAQACAGGTDTGVTCETIIRRCVVTNSMHTWHIGGLCKMNAPGCVELGVQVLRQSQAMIKGGGIRQLWEDIHWLAMPQHVARGNG